MTLSSKTISNIIFSIILLFYISSCATTQKITNPYQHISDKKVVETLKKSFKTLGGLENWQHLKELHYDKHSTLLLASGEVESAVFQNHDYYYQPIQEINISWQGKDGLKQKITSKEGKTIKYIDKKIDKTANESSLNTSITTTLFVVSVPFKMLDKGVELSHEGTDVLEDGQKVEVIKAVYSPSTHANHTTPDIWWYYFDTQDFKLVGYMVKHADHYSYVRNRSYIKNGTFTFPAIRESYRVDPNRNILYLRAKYKYENWKAVR